MSFLHSKSGLGAAQSLNATQGLRRMNGLQMLRPILLLALLLAPACNTPGKGYRPQSIDPDETLLDLYEAYEAGTDQRDTVRGSLNYDPGHYWNEIQKLAVEFPRHIPTLFACSAIAYDRRDYELSATYLDSLFHVQPVHPEAGVLRSRVSIREGNTNRATDVLTQQIRYTPDNAGLREALAAVLYLVGDYDGALDELEMAARLGAPAWRLEFNLGLIHEVEGRTEEAMAAYQAALDENPDCGEAASRLAGLRARAGEDVR